MPFRLGMNIAKPQYRIPVPSPDPNRLVQEIVKVGIVTPDLGRLVTSYTRQLGIGPWQLTTLDTSQSTQAATLRGQPAHFKARIARADIAGTTLELVQPLEGPSLYAEWLDQHGEGIHYLGVTTTPTHWPQILDQFASAASPALMASDPQATARYAYFDTTPYIKTTLEVST